MALRTIYVPLNWGLPFLEPPIKVGVFKVRLAKGQSDLNIYLVDVLTSA